MLKCLTQKCAVILAIQSSVPLSQFTCTNLQSPEGLVLDSSDLVARKVKDPEVLQTPEHVRGDQVDEVTVEGQLQKLPLAEKGSGLQG